MPVVEQNIFARCGVGPAVVKNQGAGSLRRLVRLLAVALFQLFFSFPKVNSVRNHLGPDFLLSGKSSQPVLSIFFHHSHTKYNSSLETGLNFLPFSLHKFVYPLITVCPCKGIVPFKPGI
ncbi:hypothetical protein [Desulfovibrio sp. JC022]|uniref:hypothetical protein n=1 Tax=Desulfovibrio sp. JC022 TaxID=2593642 RepID=UPI0013CFFF0F|nr:hypothetical protein [Desulfovibrio sp. JC022]NDV21171.1 hypothetical protein [Desulfovibrio sp. JC022]